MKALVIEDDPIYLLYLKKYLEKLGLTVLTTDLGAAVIKIAIDQKPDIILLDIGLPDMIGTDCLDLLKKNPDTFHIPVITMTADAADLLKEEILHLGAHVYLQKPVSPDQLAFYVGKISEMLESPEEG